MNENANDSARASAHRAAFLTSAVALLVLLATDYVAYAASIYATPTTMTAAPGDTVMVEVWMDFSETTLTALFNVQYDASGLTFENRTFAPVGDPLFQSGPDIKSGIIHNIGIGDFDVGITGINLIGTLKLSVAVDAADGEYSIALTKGSSPNSA